VPSGSGEPGVGGKVVVEVITEVAPAGALVRDEVPALPLPAAVEGGEVLATLPAPAAMVTGEVLPALRSPVSAEANGLATPGSLALLSEA
jgi:hypothetical protein